MSYISPASALSEGGTPLTVHGSGFSSASEALGVLTCRVGGAVRRARVGERARAIVCNATRARAGEARLEVSNNAREYTSSGVRVRLVSVRVLDVQPWSGPRRRDGGERARARRVAGRRALPAARAARVGCAGAAARRRRRRAAGAALRDGASRARGDAA